MLSRRSFLKKSIAATIAASPAASVIAADKPQLPTRPIPGSDERLPIVGLGNAVAFQEGNIGLTRQLLDILLDHGGQYIDTTGPSRMTVGSIVTEMDALDRTFLATYVDQPDEAAARRDIDAVRAVQNGAPLDLILTRHIDQFSGRRDEFRGYKEEGLTRYVGVARHQLKYHDAMMRLMQDGAVDFVQVNYSMLEPEAEDRLLPMAADKGVAIVINRPFINGQWFSLVRGRELPEWAAEFDCETWAQFSLKFILSHPAVTCVLTETSNPRHAVDNVGGGLGRLPDEAERARMRELVRSFV